MSEGNFSQESSEKKPDERDSPPPTSDAEMWSTLGYEALSVIWGIPTDGLDDQHKQALTAATVELRSQDPETFDSLQREILEKRAGERLAALMAKLF